jgi:plasmid stabilization system protein ParE
MAKPKTVEWVDKALLQLYQVAAYIKGEFGRKVADAFIIKAFAQTDTLAKYPEIGRPSKRFKTIRYVRLGKHHRMYYRVKGGTLFVIALFDTRQDPGKDPYQ